MGCKMDKKTVRSQARKARNSLTPDEVRDKSRIIMGKVLALPKVACAREICVYANVGSEVVTLPLIDELLKLGKSVYVPLVNGTEMDFYKVSSTRELVEGFHGIPEPDGTTSVYDGDGDGAVMVMPGLAFDKSLNRVGYGGGYYDRYLATRRAFFKLAVCFKEQLFDAIEAEDTDMPVDMLVTDAEP
jgi:5-formyltetrahydrofolate cyclo-ligase